MISRVDPLHWQVPITDKNGFPTPEFQRKWAQQHDVNSSVPDVSGGAAGALLYKLSSANLDVGWSTGLVWDETNDVLSIGVGASGGLRTQVLYDPSALNAGAVINNWQTVGGANTSQNIIHLNYGLQLTGANNALHAVATQGAVLWDSTGALLDATGSYSNVRARGTTGGVISDARASRTQIITSGAAQVTVGEGLLAESPSISNTSTIGTLYGARIKSQKTGAAVTKGYGVYAEGTSDLNVLAGRTTIGSAADPTASVALDVNSTTGALLPPRMTTTQKNALTPTAGMIVQDTTLGKLQQYQGSAWADIGTGSGGGGGGKVTVPQHGFSGTSAFAANDYILLGLFLPAGAVVDRVGIAWAAANATAKWAVAIYGGTLTTVTTNYVNDSLITGTTANVVNWATLTSAFTAPADGIYWIGVWCDTAVSVWGTTNHRQAFWADASRTGANNPAASFNTNGAGTYVSVKYP